MSLLHDIRDDLVTESASLSNTLRKARILSHDIDLPELRDWVRSELAGYPDPDTTPEYRHFRTVNLGTFHGPFGSELRNQVLPTTTLPEPLRSFAEQIKFQQSVGELEELLSQDSTRLPWPAEAVVLAREHITVQGGMVLAYAHKPIPKHAISGIIDNVRNRLLDFVLDVPVTGSELENGTFDRSRVRNVFLTNIYGDDNAVAVGERVTQDVSTIAQGDSESLLRYLGEQGIADPDLLSLKEALALEPSAAGNALGPAVNSWIGRMIGKAASGAWAVAIQTAPNVLLESLRKYYGW